MHSQDGSPSRSALDHLLAWFDYERERAWREYADFAPRLVRYFLKKGCGSDSEDLAQDVLLRTTRKFEERYPDQEPKPYLYRVAHFILLEWVKKRQHVEMSDDFDLPDPSPSVERIVADDSQARFVRSVMDEALEPEDLSLFLRYIEADAEGRARLAAERGSNANALRVKIADVKKKLIAALHKRQRVRPAPSAGADRV